MKKHFTKIPVILSASEGSRNGFTLMELLVYMMIVGIIVIVAGQAFSNSTKFRVRTQNMLKATQEAENVATLFKSDIALMGAKSSKENGEDVVDGASYGQNFYTVCTGAADADDCISRQIYVDPDNALAAKKDSSSFEVKNKSTNIDDITFLRIRYDNNGYYQGIEKIKWSVEGTTLYRTCQVIVKKTGVVIPNDDPCQEVQEGSTPTKVSIATGVKKFHIIVASPSVSVDAVQVFPICSATCPNDFKLLPRSGDGDYVTFKATNSGGSEVNGGTEIILSQFFSNFSNTTNGGQVKNKTDWKRNQAIALNNVAFVGEASWNDRCNTYGKISLEQGQEYEISFEIAYPGSGDKSLMFVPGEDHMAVGFRSATTGDYLKSNGRILVDDFFIFPPLNNDGSKKRSMRFRVNAPVNDACLAFTFASFSPLVSQGKITIKNLKLKKIATSNYTFETPFDAEAAGNIVEKKNVKAMKLVLQISRGGKNDKEGETGELEMVVPVPSNGPRD